MDLEDCNCSVNRITKLGLLDFFGLFPIVVIKKESSKAYSSDVSCNVNININRFLPGKSHRVGQLSADIQEMYLWDGL